MHGHMMETPLLVTDILRHAVRTTPNAKVYTRLVEGGYHEYTFADAGKRIAQLAHALNAMGIGVGDRVGVMAWNTHRQLELYYATACIGAVCHTINPRLGPENAGYVINHAGDKVLFFDTTFAPLAAGLSPHLPQVQRYIAMAPAGTGIAIGDQQADDYESLLEGQPEAYDWPVLDENTACGLCYTSGTTGKPKGVAYTHRSTCLHALVGGLPTSIGFNQHDVVQAIVPMFHVNAWGLPYVCFLLGTELMMPGPGLDGPSIHADMEKFGVTYSVGVPTVWLNLLKHVEDKGLKFSTLRYVLSGGAALSERIIDGFDALGVRTRQGWGMTETSPVGTVNFEDPDLFDRPRDERVAVQLLQGKAVPFIDLRLVGPNDQVLPHDGKSEGYLHIRGPWVTGGYFNHDGATLTQDGWFDTGDVSVIHPDGRMQITDRAKDVIKSGGEWLSSIEIENAAMSHPAVAQAAAVGMPHPKWQERPLLIVELKEAAKDTDPTAILSEVREKLPKISWPDDIQVMDTIPLGATGKVLKRQLREEFSSYTLPTAKNA